MSQAASKFITDLVTVFPKKHESPAAEREWLKMMLHALRGYDPAVLSEAAEKIVDNRTDMRFPLPAECRDVCDQIMATRALAQREKTLPVLRKQAGYDWSQERKDLANDMLKTNLGRQAAKEGCVLGFWHFCVEEQRLPDANKRCQRKTHAHDQHNEYFNEIECMKRGAKWVDEFHAEAVRNGIRHEWVERAEMMLERREKYRREALGQ
jgi:hypothetical protein